MAASTTLTPEQRRERARKAGQAAHSTDVYVKAVVKRLNEKTLTAAELATLAAAVEAASK